jgi:hypothetical protein
MVSDQDLYVFGKNVSTRQPSLALSHSLPLSHMHKSQILSWLEENEPRQEDRVLTLAAKSIVLSKTIESGSSALVIETARLLGGEGVSVLGRGVLEPLAVSVEEGVVGVDLTIIVG